jgi:integral membrane sensor domain MASE1
VWETSVIDRVLGTIVGMVLGAMAGSMPMLWMQTVTPGYSAAWYQWAILMVPAAIVGSVFGFMGGLRAIFDWS